MFVLEKRNSQFDCTLLIGDLETGSLILYWFVWGNFNCRGFFRLLFFEMVVQETDRSYQVIWIHPAKEVLEIVEKVRIAFISDVDVRGRISMYSLDISMENVICILSFFLFELYRSDSLS